MRLFHILVLGCLITKSFCLFSWGNKVVESLGTVVGGAVNTASKVVSDTSQVVGNVAAGAVDTASKVISGTGQVVGGVVANTGQVVGNVAAGAVDTASKVVSGTGQVVGGIVAGTGQVAGNVIAGTGNVLGNVLTGTGQVVGGVLGGLGEIAGAILGTGVGIFDAGVDMFGNAVKSVLTFGGKTVGSVVDTGVNVVCAVLGSIVNCKDLPGKGSIAPLPFQCRGKADIIFVVDASGSVGSLNFKKLLSFAANLAGSYLLGADNARFGLVVFSTEYQKVFDLKSFSSPLDLIQAILKTPNSGGLTYTDKALNSIITNRMFDPINGGRSDAKDIVITLTDGQSNSPFLTSSAAAALKSNGATLFSVGIGWGNNQGELVTLASSAEFVFNVDDFDRLDNFLYQLAQKTCAASGGLEKPVIVEPPVVEVKPACEAQADIVLIIDSSGSIGPKNYWKLLNFTVDLANQFKIGKSGVLFGSVVFSTSAQKWFDLKDNQNIEALRRAILSTPYLNSTTNTDRALDLVRSSNMFGRSAGGRDGAQNIAIIITDGASDKPDKTIVAAGKLKSQQDASIIALGIGNVRRAELEAVASSSSDVFVVNSFDALNNVKQSVAKRACEKTKKK